MSDTLGKIITITSGKGGVGKTTSSAAIGAALAEQGYKVVIIDFDVGLRNLDLIMGCERRVVYDFIDVIEGRANATQALIKDKDLDNLFVFATSQTKDKDALDKEGVGKVLDELKTKFDFILCDSPAGIERGALLALYYADEAIIVTNPEVSSVRDSDRIIGVLDSRSKRAEEEREPVKKHLLLARYDPNRVESKEMLSFEDVLEIIRLPLIGVIPESKSVLKASNIGRPVTLDKKSKAGQAYKDAVERFFDNQVPLRFLEAYSPGFFEKIFGGNKE